MSPAGPSEIGVIIVAVTMARSVDRKDAPVPGKLHTERAPAACVLGETMHNDQPVHRLVRMSHLLGCQHQRRPVSGSCRPAGSIASFDHIGRRHAPIWAAIAM